MKITCHMIMSVDGRLLPKYWSPLYNASSSVTEVYEAADAKSVSYTHLTLPTNSRV